MEAAEFGLAGLEEMMCIVVDEVQTAILRERLLSEGDMVFGKYVERIDGKLKSYAQVNGVALEYLPGWNYADAPWYDGTKQLRNVVRYPDHSPTPCPFVTHGLYVFVIDEMLSHEDFTFVFLIGSAEHLIGVDEMGGIAVFSQLFLTERSYREAFEKR